MTLAWKRTTIKVKTGFFFNKNEIIHHRITPSHHEPNFDTHLIMEKGSKIMIFSDGQEALSSLMQRNKGYASQSCRNQRKECDSRCSGKCGKENEPVSWFYLQTTSTLKELVSGIQEQVRKWKGLNVGKSWVTASSLYFGRCRKNFLLPEDVLNN